MAWIDVARADGFKRMVAAAGQRWPHGWVKGEGLVRPADVVDPLTRPPTFDETGEEYVRQIVDLSPGNGSGTSVNSTGQVAQWRRLDSVVVVAGL